MSAVLVFSVLTLALWMGIGLCVRALITILRIAFRAPGSDARAMVSRLGFSAGLGGLLVAIGSLIPKSAGAHLSGPFFPILWLYSPIGGWLLMLGVGAAIYGIAAWRRSLTTDEANRHKRAVVAWLIIAGLGLWWLRHTGGEISVLRGGIPLDWRVLVAVIALAIGAIAAMVRAEQALRERGIVRSAVLQLVLLSGAILFGIPFAWMLSTSFKEERDLANTNGIMWIPQVQRTHEYLDPENPQYETKFENYPVKVVKVRSVSPTRVLVEVERPYGLRGRRFETSATSIREVPRDQPIWRATVNGQQLTGFTVRELDSGDRLIEVLEPASRKGEWLELAPEDLDPVRDPGLRWANYTEALEWMPLETVFGLRYLINTLWLVVMSVIGTVLSCSVVAYGFARLRFPGRDALFGVMLATMMLPGAVTMLPQFLIFRGLGWVDTLMPLWVPTFFAGAFNVFLLKQFFSTIPRELEEAARIDGAGYFRTFWQVMLPLVKPALAAISIWTFMGAWNNFMGPLIYVSTPSKMPLAYALSLFASDRGTDIALMMAFATMTTIPVVLLFFLAQRYFIEGVQISGLGGR